MWEAYNFTISPFLHYLVGILGKLKLNAVADGGAKSTVGRRSLS